MATEQLNKTWKLVYLCFYHCFCCHFGQTTWMYPLMWWWLSCDVFQCIQCKGWASKNLHFSIHCVSALIQYKTEWFIRLYADGKYSLQIIAELMPKLWSIRSRKTPASNIWTRLWWNGHFAVHIVCWWMSLLAKCTETFLNMWTKKLFSSGMITIFWRIMHEILPPMEYYWLLFCETVSNVCEVAKCQNCIITIFYSVRY